jgi:hypothetical protein
MGLVHLGKIQLAAEGTATPGTVVTTATYLLPVMSAAWHEEANVDQPEELRGDLAKYHRGDILGRMATIDVEADCAFETAPYFFEMNIKHTTGVSDASGTPAYKYTWEPTLTAADVPQTYSIQVGDDTAGNAFVSAFTFGRNLEISAAIEERSRLRTALVAQSLIAQAFTPGLNRDPTMESAVGQKWAVWVDDSGGTIGTTPFAGVLTGFTWRLPNTFEPHKSIDGTLVFNSVKQTPIAPELELTVEVDAAAIAMRTDFLAGTRQLVRLKNTGGVIHAGTPTATASKYLQIDGAYRVTDWGVVGGSDNSGVQTVRVMLTGEFDPTWGKLYQIQANIAGSVLV